MISSGSYPPSDVTFLLKEIKMETTDVVSKEKLIQSGKAHYSEMLTVESPPSPEYLSIFKEALSSHGGLFKGHLLNLADKILEDYIDNPEIVIVSLARAGTPCGVLVTRLLKSLTSKPISHYCVSIIRDRGIDINALNTILAKHHYSDVVFVDGWTGKGAIGRELTKSVNEFNSVFNTALSSNLYVVADISGTAYYGATYSDYLIPSAVLNATVSGLISRTVLNDSIGPSDYHGAVFYSNLKPFDVSSVFIDAIMQTPAVFKKEPSPNISKLQEVSKATIDKYVTEFNLASPNLVKPGIGEATRVLLRRSPRCLIVSDVSDPKVAHLIHLAQTRKVPILLDNDLQYSAVAIIRQES